MQDSTMRIEVEIPRGQVIIARKLTNNSSVKEAIERSIAAFTDGWESGISISKAGINAISSLLNVKSFNSEESLVGAIEKRFNVSASTVTFEVDPSLANLIKRKAVGTDVPFNEYVRRFVHSMFRYGILDWGLKTIFFHEGEWKRAKAALGNVPSTGENIARVLEEWKHLKANATLAALPPAAPPAEGTKKDELSASERNIQKAVKEDEERKRLQGKAAVGIDKESPEYRQRLAESMNRMTAPKKPEPIAPIENSQTAELPGSPLPEVEVEAAEGETESVKIPTDESGNAAAIEIPNF